MVISVVAAIAVVAGAVPASAGTGLCNSGYACGYDHLSYDGAVFGTAQNTSNWGRQGFANRATSVSVNGRTCKYTTFHTSWSAWTNLPSGDSFRLNSRQLLGTSYRDPDLRNGAGTSPGRSFDDKIMATQFSGC